MTPFPLVMLHRTGGSAADFAALTHALPPSVLPLAFELPGRGIRRDEEPVTCAQDAVADLAERVAAAGVTGNFAVLGHGLGSYLGLALAALLEGDPMSPARCTTLFALDSPGPFRARTLLGSDPPKDPADRTGQSAPAHGTAREEGVRRADLAVHDSFVTTMRRTVTESKVVACTAAPDIPQEPAGHWRLSSTATTEVVRLPAGGAGSDAPLVRALADLITRHTPLPAPL